MSQVDSLKTGKRFKNTEIGEIPVDWEVGFFSDVCAINPTYKIPKGTECAYVEMAAVSSDRPFVSYFTRRSIDKSGGTRFKEGDTLFARITPCTENGKVALIKSMSTKYGLGSTEFIVLSPNQEKLDSTYLFYSVKQDLVRNYAIARMIGTTGRQRVPIEVFKNELRIAYPPLPEQKKIAEILTNVDEAIEKSNEIIEKTKELKKGLMQELLTRGIGHKKFKKTKIGEIPMDWEVVRIGDICDVVGGSTPSTNRKEYWNGDILWAVPTDITKLKGNVISNTEKKITKAGLSACAAKLLPEGSILLTSRATIGACAINTKPMATNQGFASLICKANVHNWFIFYKIVSMRKELERLGSGSTFKETSKKSIRAIKIPFLPVHEQKKIAKLLSAVDEEIEKESANKEKLEQTKKGLMQVLLMGKVRVKGV